MNTIKKLCLIGFILFFSSVCYAQTESFSRLDTVDSPLPSGIQLQLGNSPAYMRFSWEQENNLQQALAQDYILDFSFNPQGEFTGLGFSGIIAGDRGTVERNMLGFYDQSDFTNKQLLFDQQLSYSQGDFSASLRFIDIPEEVNFSSNLNQDLLKRYGSKRITDILDWRQMEYTVNFGQMDTEHLALSYLSGERQNKPIEGYRIDLKYDLLDQLPIAYVDSRYEDGTQLVVKDLLSVERSFGDFYASYVDSSESVKAIDTSAFLTAEDIDKLVLGAKFDFGAIQYIDSYHRTLSNRREITESELGWDMSLAFDSLSLDYHDKEKRQTDTKTNLDLMEDIVALQLTYDRLAEDKYFLQYTNRDGAVIKNERSTPVEDNIYKVVYMVNDDQKLSFNYIDTLFMDELNIELFPVLKYWPIGIAYIDKDKKDGDDSTRLAFTFPKKEVGFMSIDAAYTVENLITPSEKQKQENIQVNTGAGDFSLALQKQKDQVRDNNSESLSLLWKSDQSHADWLYSRKNNDDSWAFRLGRQIGDSMSTDYQLLRNDELYEHVFALSWNIIEGMNASTNLNLRDEEHDSLKSVLDAKFSDNSDLIIEYFSNPLNKKNQMQEGECYRLAWNQELSDLFAISYVRSDMAFDSNGNLIPTEEESIRLLYSLDSLKSEVAYVNSIDKILIDRSRMEYIVIGKIGEGDLKFKLLDYKNMPNFFDISFSHQSDTGKLIFHAISDPPKLEKVDIGEEYETFKYYIEYNSIF